VKRIVSLISPTIISGALAGAVGAGDKVIFQEQIGDNYFHRVVETTRPDDSGPQHNQRSQVSMVLGMSPSEPGIMPLIKNMTICASAGITRVRLDKRRAAIVRPGKNLCHLLRMKM